MPGGALRPRLITTPHPGPTAARVPHPSAARRIGSGDVLCRVAARSHGDLQRTLLQLGRSGSVVRSTSVVALSELVPMRTLPLLAAEEAPPARAPGHRGG